jgi:hypothetical protein
VKDQILPEINKNEVEELSSRPCVPCIQKKTTPHIFPEQCDQGDQHPRASPL